MPQTLANAVQEAFGSSAFSLCPDGIPSVLRHGPPDALDSLRSLRPRAQPAVIFAACVPPASGAPDGAGLTGSSPPGSCSTSGRLHLVSLSFGKHPITRARVPRVLVARPTPAATLTGFTTPAHNISGWDNSLHSLILTGPRSCIHPTPPSHRARFPHFGHFHWLLLWRMAHPEDSITLRARGARVLR